MDTQRTIEQETVETREEEPRTEETVFQLDYDREVTYLFNEGFLSPELVPTCIKR